MSSPTPPIPDDALLLCLDLQPKFLAAVARGAEVQRRCEFAIAAATGFGLPVAFTEQVPEKMGRTASELLAIAPGAAIFPKTAFSALADDAIRNALLEQRSVQHLLLCGIETPICVYQTAVAALGLGLHVTILSDAVGARRPDDARVCLDALARAGAFVLPSETVFYAMLGDVGHPFFRAFTQRVKAAQDSLAP